MTTQGEYHVEKRQANVFAVVGLVIGLLIVLFVIGSHFLAKPSPSLADEMDLDKHPIPAWIAQDAKQCEGDIAKLSPEEQKKVRAAYPGQGARTIIMAAYATQH